MYGTGKGDGELFLHLFDLLLNDVMEIYIHILVLDDWNINFKGTTNILFD